MTNRWRIVFLDNGFLISFSQMDFASFFQMLKSAAKVDGPCLSQVLAATKSRQPATTCYHAELDSIKIHLAKPAAKLQGVTFLDMYYFSWFLRSVKVSSIEHCLTN